MKRMVMAMFVSLVVAAHGQHLPQNFMPASWVASYEYGKKWAQLLIGASDIKAADSSVRMMARAGRMLEHPCRYSSQFSFDYEIQNISLPVSVTEFRIDRNFRLDDLQMKLNEKCLRKLEEKIKEEQAKQVLRAKHLQEVQYLIQRKMQGYIPNPA